MMTINKNFSQAQTNLNNILADYSKSKDALQMRYEVSFYLPIFFNIPFEGIGDT